MREVEEHVPFDIQGSAPVSYPVSPPGVTPVLPPRSAPQQIPACSVVFSGQHYPVCSVPPPVSASASASDSFQRKIQIFLLLNFFCFLVFRSFRLVLCSIYRCLTHFSPCSLATLPSCCPRLTSPVPQHTFPTTHPICPSLASLGLIQRSRLDRCVPIFCLGS